MRPILFNTEMVRAILADRKTVTRRVVKPKPLWRKTPIQQRGHTEYWANWDDERVYKAPYRPGDILYVRETWERSMAGTYLYKATDIPFIHDGWRPSIHMPKEAARIFLRVTDVRVERLQDISEYGAEREGVTLPLVSQSDPEYAEYIGGYYSAFGDLWDKTIKPADRALYGWAANPWVWVIAFERISKEEAYELDCH